MPTSTGHCPTDRARMVVDDHLTRFGARDELMITWQAVASPTAD